MAMYIIATNRPKNSAEVPMSLSKTSTQQADAPGDEHRAQVAGPGQVDAEEPAAGQRQHVPLGDQVTGEEHGQRELGELSGWIVKPPSAIWILAPVPGTSLMLSGSTAGMASRTRPTAPSV